jgi:predicted phosphodiesterase
VKIAVISDIHLGRGDRADAFEHDDFDFLRFLAYLESNFERIVLLGDIWETLTVAPHARLTEFLAAQAAHLEIAQRFQQAQYTYVMGNHDLVAGHAVGAVNEFALEVDGLRLLFAHGHQSDYWCSQGRGFSERGVRIATWLKYVGLKTVYKALAALELARNPANREVKSWAFSQEADVVITGHTHKADKDNQGSRLFLNSGHCAHGAFNFLALDTQRLDFEVCHSF